MTNQPPSAMARTPTPPSTSSTSPRMKTVQTLLDGYASLSVPNLLAPLADTFHHRVLPESLGMPVRDKTAFSHHAQGVFNIFDRFRLVPQSIHEDAANNTVVVHARMRGLLKGGAGEWRNEVIMMISFSEDGTRVEEVAEFVDSAKTAEMRRRNATKEFDGHTSARSSRSPSGRRSMFKGSAGDVELPVWLSGVNSVFVVCLLYHFMLVAVSWLLGLRIY